MGLLMNDEIAKELKERQKAAWDKLHKKVRLEITQWAELADDLDEIINDIVDYFDSEVADDD